MVGINAKIREQDAIKDFESEAFLRNYVHRSDYVLRDDLDTLRSENDRLTHLVERLQNSETAKEATINMLLDRLYEAKSAVG